MTAGEVSSEFKSGKKLTYIAFAVAVFVSVTKLGITPEVAQAQMASLAMSAEEWAKVLAPPIAAMQVAYSAGRSYVKGKQAAAEEKPEA